MSQKNTNQTQSKTASSGGQDASKTAEITAAEKEAAKKAADDLAAKEAAERGAAEKKAAEEEAAQKAADEKAAKESAEQKAAAEEAAKSAELEAATNLRLVRSSRDPYRRGGVQLGRKERLVDFNQLTADEIARLEKDPNVFIET